MDVVTIFIELIIYKKLIYLLTKTIKLIIIINRIMNYYLERTKEAESFNYPNNFKQNININDLLDEIDNKIKLPGEINKDKVYQIAGRVLLKRKYGKLYFYTLKIENKKFQILCNVKEYTNDDFKIINEKIQMGDIIGVTGYISISNTKEPSLVPIKIELLSPCLHLIPKSFESENEDSNNGKIVDLDVRYRKRYLDLIINENSINVFIKRSKIIKYIRNYLDSLSFIEVETPILHKSYGGANAKPFITFHNDLKQNMFLRIAPELNLKQLAIGGMDKIYEIGKQFRNESLSPYHNPEFSSLELYQNYANYEDSLKLCEDLISELIKNVNGSYLLDYNNKTIDFTPPFNRIDICSKLTECGVDMNYVFDNLDNNNSVEYLKNKCIEYNLTCYPLTVPKMLDKLIGHFIEPICINPTFLMNHPSIMSPLAKSFENNKNLSERFELFVNTKEIANGYSELNNPRIQKQNFENQLKDKNNGDDEAQIPDMDFVVALEYGLPHNSGLGIGLDRIIMMLTNNNNIKEVMTFPIIK